jgi:DNA-binding Lrp family transcriptional regulator
MTNCLLEAASIRKNKISLTDYNYQKDIENRLLMACFTDTDIEVLEEILYSPIQIPFERLSKSLSLSKEDLLPTLEKLSKTDLLSFDNETILVNKEMRKYFEFQIEKFSEDFKPGMDFLQGLLKKAPIHVLPIWYSIPRTSNNIFDSLVEKYLETPQIFQRYIVELNLGEPILKNIIQDVYSAENFEVSSLDLMKKYNISRELFEEYMLHLEFSFVCCLGYRKIEDRWEEKVTPFQEWKEYLGFLKNTEATPIKNVEEILLKRPSEYSFVQDLTIIIEATNKETLQLEKTKDGLLIPAEKQLNSLLPLFPALSKDPSVYKPYIHYLISKLVLVRLCTITDNKLQTTDTTSDWLAMRLDSQSLYFYRHPKNRILDKDVNQDNYSEKALREAEKSISRVLHKGWILFDDFFKGILAPLRDEHNIMLKKIGRNWEYTIPKYTVEDTSFLKASVLQWLFEAGIVQVGTLNGKDCFRVTTLGQTLFAK